ncbi:hypothetical protein DB347_01875 [Opitutaceae bacterium EW11]|nr:hypothetical protein DB347_01875 [Opitutaceae bacterium EW11]
MSTVTVFDTVDPYLNSQWRESQTPWRRESMGGPFITVSREAGSGGSSFARLLARKLNSESGDGTLWRVYEGNLIAKMLEDNRLPRRLARYLPEQRIPEVAAIIGELVGLHPNLWNLVQKTNETMRRLAAGGHVILVGRGANFATAGMDNATHIRLVAPAEHRARYLAQQYNISEKQARALNAKCDAARRSYVRANFGSSVSDPCAYDLVINTAATPLPEAARLVGAHLRRQASPSPEPAVYPLAASA